LKKLRTIYLFCVGLFLLICFNATQALGEPEVANLQVQTDDHLVFIDATLLDAFTERIQEAIESGVPMSFKFEIELVRKVSFFADEIISFNHLTHTLHYDTLKKVYQFSSDGKNVHRNIMTKDMTQGQNLMLTLKHIPIAPLYKLDPAEKYYVRVKAELEADGLWFPFNYILFFVPFNEFETPWSETSLLVFNQDYDFPMEATGDKKSSGSGSEGLDDVVRSFNK